MIHFWTRVLLPHDLYICIRVKILSFSENYLHLLLNLSQSFSYREPILSALPTAHTVSTDLGANGSETKEQRPLPGNLPPCPPSLRVYRDSCVSEGLGHRMAREAAGLLRLGRVLKDTVTEPFQRGGQR